ncbi:MAG: hypothetical protein Q8L27_02690 [archaeon]|nr:hypothetical protein [archaeon]
MFKFRNSGTEYLTFIIGIFMTLFLFLISLESIILQFKTRQGQQEKDTIEKQYYELRTQNKTLSESNKELIERHKFIMKLLLKEKR